MNEKQVAELFIEQHVLQPSQAEDVLNEANLNGKTIIQAMVDSGFVDETGFYHTIADALGPRAAEDLRFALGKDVDVVVAPTEQIDNRIKEYYGADTTSMEEVLKQLGEAGDLLQIRGDEPAAAVEAEANATPIIRFVDLILYQAIQDR